MDKTGKIGEPCGVLTAESSGSERILLNLRQTLLSERKEVHQLTISGAKIRS